MPHHRKKEVSSHDPTSLAGLLPAGIQSGDFPLIPPICLSEPVNEFMLFQHSDEVQQGKRRNEQDVNPEVVDHEGEGHSRDGRRQVHRVTHNSIDSLSH